MKKGLLVILVLALLLGAYMIASSETEDGMKLGLAVRTSVASSKDAGATDGNAQTEATAAAVLIDANGKLVNAVIDVAQVTIAFSAQGTITTDLDKEWETKRELGDLYGMKAASKIGKEWYEQADALRSYVIGKTADEIKGIAVDQSGRATDEALLAGCTIGVGDFKDALLTAMENATAVTAAAGDKLGLGVVTDVSASKNASAGAEGLCQAYNTYAAVALNKDGAVSGCLVNGAQANVSFDAAGKITSDLAADVEDKKALGDRYGMRAASKIGKEWYEQAAGFEAYTLGKTASDIRGIAVDERGYPQDAELTASVTIGVENFQTAVLKAMESVR